MDHARFGWGRRGRLFPLPSRNVIGPRLAHRTRTGIRPVGRARKEDRTGAFYVLSWGERNEADNEGKDRIAHHRLRDGLVHGGIGLGLVGERSGGNGL